MAVGYRREYQVEHRGELAVRGSIIDIWPSTDDAPVRIDLWGDEVERLTEFGVADQRATVPRSEVELHPCRELLPDDEVRARAAQLVASEPWGREQWDRLADGELFDGMESWLPWLSGDERVLFDLVDDDALVVAVEPRRLRDRIADLQAEEAELAATLATTWGADDTVFPRLHTDWERLLVHTGAPVWTMDAVPDGPGVETVQASGWGRDVAVAVIAEDPEGPAGRLRRLLADSYRVVVAADGEGSADQLTRRLLEAEIEVYEIAKHYELRAADTLAPAAFYNWGNSIGDPTTSTGFAMFGPSPHSVWDGEDLTGMIGPLWGEADDAKRIAGWKAVDRHIAENALVLPLFQYVQPILHAPGVKVVPHASGALLPHLMTRA